MRGRREKGEEEEGERKEREESGKYSTNLQCGQSILITVICSYQGEREVFDPCGSIDYFLLTSLSQ